MPHVQPRVGSALGTVKPGLPYAFDAFDMGGGFEPFRRDVAWWDTRAVPIADLLQTLELTAGVRNWGYALRLGLLQLCEGDMDRISAAMRCDAAAPQMIKAELAPTKLSRPAWVPGLARL
jgi:hypothetical protein